MPCNADYMEPTVAEQQRKEAAVLVEYVLEQTGRDVPKHISEMATNPYGEHKLDIVIGEGDLVLWLCSQIKEFTKEQEDTILYDGRNPMARRLADWWEVHKVEDEKRERMEKRGQAARMAVPQYLVWDSEGRYQMTTQFYRVAYDKASQSGGAIQRVSLHANDFVFPHPDDCGE